jgi:3',5'-cyclic AMP phosphodiesterase CpdA
MPPAFDLSLLPTAPYQFTIVSDTHYMLDPGSAALEFESRRHQSGRAFAALRLAAALPTDFAIHLGDLVQEYPDTPNFARALDEALQQLHDCGFAPKHVAGNHDVGDKPDPAMPTHPVNAEILELYHKRFGPSYYAFDCGPLRAIALNSQIFNTTLATEQRAFFERELHAHAERRLAVFLHLPPYLWDPNEAHQGHYDNIGEPDRSWLLDLLKRYNVEILFCGHVHFSFYDQLRNTRLVVCPSTSFTRPGFGHLFASASAPEQGRDDSPKLGFYFCRLVDDRIDLHLVRSEGSEITDTAETRQTRLLTRTPAALQGAPLGLTLTHPLCPSVEVPITFPSVVRQRVRNDYPFLACLELGATRVRAPWTDLDDPLQKRRLQMLRAEGVGVQIFAPYCDELDLHHLLDQHPDAADLWELQIAGSPWPDAGCLHKLADCRRRTRLALSPILPGEKVYGKQHPRTRLGFRVDELVELNRLLAASDVALDAVCCRIEDEAGPWQTINAYSALPTLTHIGRVDWLLSLPDRDDETNAHLAAEALFATARLPNAQLFVDPPQDLDRTMDVCHGLLDARCNPRPAFHVLRTLNTLVHVYRGTGFAAGEGLELFSNHKRLQLLLDSTQGPAEPGAQNLLLYDLARGVVGKEMPAAHRPLLVVSDP